MTDPNRHNPLDDLFRRKAEEYNDISFNEADWQKMEKKLEARDQLAASRRRQYWLSAAATLIIALLSYYTYQNTTELNELNQILNESMTEVAENETSGPDEPEEAATPDSEVGNNTAITDNSAATSAETLTPAIPGETESAGSLAASENSLPASPSSEFSINGETESSGSLAVTGAPTGDNATADVSPDEGNETLPEAPESPLAQSVGIETSREFTAVALTREELPSVTCPDCDVELQTDLVPIDVDMPLDGTVAANRTGSFADNVNSDNSNTLASADQQFTNRRPRLTIGLNVSPDLSSAGSLSNYTGPGYRFGVTVDYRITKNLSISTGLIHSTVKYNANRGDYNPPAEYFYGRYSPASTFAECVLLDIPLRLKMDVWNNNRSGLFVSAGLSSYLMLNEEYQFNYENSQPELGTHWASRTGTFHLMSNAGFSVGYEMNLMQSVSLRAEPYVRLPLREVGWGNVRLYSVGTLFSLNYQFM